MTQTEIINAIVAGNAETAMSLEQIIAKEVNDWRNSDEYNLMLKADKYYKYKTEILDRKRQAINANGELEEVENLSNRKLNHGFFRKIVDQKAGYLLSKLPVVNTNEKAEENEKKPIQEELTENYKRLFNKLPNIGVKAFKKGVSWVFVYYDPECNFLTKIIPSHEAIPLWADSEHTNLQAFIRAYDVTVFDGKKETLETKVEWWTAEDVRYFILEDDNVIPDVESAEYEGYHYKDGVTPQCWGRVPFICFKYNPDELSVLSNIKSLIDEYNLTRSDLANALADGQFDMTVFKDLGEVDLETAIINMNLYRAVKVGSEGSIEKLGKVVEIEALAIHLKQLRQDIYEFGRGVDTQNITVIGSAPSGIALKFLYADLDMDCNVIEREFSKALKDYLYFIEKDLGKDYSDKGVEFVFNRSLMINDAEQVDIANSSKGIISDRTIVANHPWVTDVSLEIKRLTIERAEAAKANAEAFGMDKT